MFVLDLARGNRPPLDKRERYDGLKPAPDESERKRLCTTMEKQGALLPIPKIAGQDPLAQIDP